MRADDSPRCLPRRGRAPERQLEKAKSPDVAWAACTCMRARWPTPQTINKRALPCPSSTRLAVLTPAYSSSNRGRQPVKKQAEDMGAGDDVHLTAMTAWMKNDKNMSCRSYPLHTLLSVCRQRKPFACLYLLTTISRYAIRSRIHLKAALGRRHPKVAAAIKSGAIEKSRIYTCTAYMPTTNRPVDHGQDSSWCRGWLNPWKISAATWWLISTGQFCGRHGRSGQKSVQLWGKRLRATSCSIFSDTYAQRVKAMEIVLLSYMS